jgi:PIN domain nuclease of toxin-antitoxin system
LRYLLDTHVLLWLARTPPKVSARALELLTRPTTVVFVSSATVWELRIKWHGKGSRTGLIDPLQAIQFAEKLGFQLAPLAPADCTTPLEVPLAHRDPFDEQLLIHAHRLGAKLLTRDRKLIGHPLALAIS